MRKKISDIYSKAFPKESGEEYSAKELAILLAGWTIALTLLFIILKYLVDIFQHD